MNDRLDLYREILEIEPNSKVFFAYAKLLSNQARIEEALSVLARGLESHPDFLEARLYYIDLLARNDKLESARMQLNRLTGIFQTHSGFWHIWSKLTAEDNPTISTTLGLLATLFNDPSLSLLQIMQAGIHAHAPEIYGEELKKVWIENKDVKPRIPTLAEVQANDLAKKDLSDAISIEAIDAPSITITPDPQIFESQAPVIPSPAAEESPITAFEEPFEPAPVDRNTPHHHRFANIHTNPYEASPQNAKISTLTKSMADLLADQGDIVGAIKIYEHHLDISDEIEKPFIRSRLEYLYSLKNPAPLSEPLDAHRPLSANISPRMQSMLSKLATRLENRA